MVLVLGYTPIALLSADRRSLLGLLGIVLVLTIGGRLSNSLRGFTSDRRIPLDSIVGVESAEGSVITRPRFVVAYDDGGTIKKRYVMLPSRYLSYTNEEFETAKSLLRQHNVSVDPS